MNNNNLDPLALYSVITYLRREIDSYYVCARIAELEGKSNSDIAYYHDQWLIYSWIYKQLVSTNEDLKEQAELLFNDLGLNMTSAINVFLRQAVNEQAIPFEIRKINSETLQALKDVENGNLIIYDNFSNSIRSTVINFEIETNEYNNDPAFKLYLELNDYKVK